MNEPILSLITVNYQSEPHLQKLLNSVENVLDLPPTEWIIVDNSPGELKLVKRLVCPPAIQDLKIVECVENRGFGVGCNRGVELARGRWLFFINPDCYFGSGTLQPLLKRLENDLTVGVIGLRIEDSGGRIELSGASFPNLWTEAALKAKKWLRIHLPLTRSWIEAPFQHYRKIDWVTGAALLVRRSSFEEIGGFDERFFLYFEEIDLCRRLKKAGYGTVFDPSLTLYHHGGVSMKKAGEITRRHYRQSQLLYYQKHQGSLSRFLLRLYLSMTGKSPRF